MGYAPGSGSASIYLQGLAAIHMAALPSDVRRGSASPSAAPAYLGYAPGSGSASIYPQDLAAIHIGRPSRDDKT